MRKYFVESFLNLVHFFECFYEFHVFFLDGVFSKLITFTSDANYLSIVEAKLSSQAILFSVLFSKQKLKLNV